MANNSKAEFMDAVREKFGNIKSITRKEADELSEEYGITRPHWLFNDPALRFGRGVYSLVGVSASAKKPKPPKAVKKGKSKVSEIESFVPVVDSAETEMVAMAPKVGPAVAASPSAPPAEMSGVASKQESLVPSKAHGYVSFGNFVDLRAIIKSSRFYPTFITGLSGNGKTMMVEQICAIEKREMIRVNITVETDEDDLIGGFRLADGKTVWQDGPVIVAMTRGAVLLLDEVDLASNKIMCLQPILEGKSIFLKKINRLVTPAPGFNIVATANTKGKGSDDGRFIGTNVLNEAFLERFSVTMEQEYPPMKVETKILSNILGSSGKEDSMFVQKLVTWADVVRRSFYDGAITEIISTRRLVHIVEAYLIFGQDRAKAIGLCLNRFDKETKDAIYELYKKVDETIDQEAMAKQAAAANSAAGKKPVGAPEDEEVAF
jgi:hypothetical protein